jgi:F-type H+-transporting ATPase subunit a
MLAGHLLVLMCVSLIIIIGNVFVAAASVPVAVFFYCFELVLVANLQAFIFALLSGIYIGTAAEPQH